MHNINAPHRPAILLLGRDNRALLAAIRSYGRRGYRVVVASSFIDPATRVSRYLSEFIFVPSYGDNPQGWKAAILTLVKKEQFDLLVPCNDLNVLPVRQHRSEIEQYVKVALPPNETLEIANDKLKCWQLAEKLGLSIPDQSIVANVAELRASAQLFNFPIYLKALSSVSSQTPQKRIEVACITNQTQLEEMGRHFHSNEIFIVQKALSGHGVGIEVLCEQGEILYTFQHERLHEPRHGGGSSYRESVIPNPLLAAAAAALMRALHYTGCAMVEFRVDPQNGRWYFLEINARLWGSLPLAIAAGADFPTMLYDLFVHGKRNFDSYYRTGIRCRNTTLDLNWMRAAVRAAPWLQGMVLLAKETGRTIASILTLRERNDTLTLDDPRPGLVERSEIFQAGFHSIARRFWQHRFLKEHVREKRKRKLDRLLSQAHSIVFVCKGNICRSPFAEHYAKQRVPGVHSVSVGTYPLAGRESPHAARAAAQAVGINLNDHRSRMVDAKLLSDADVIFVFDIENFITMRRYGYEIRQKLFFMTECLLSKNSISILDPFGKDETEFFHCYTEIKRYVDALSQALPYTEKATNRILVAEGENL
jgi:predicted ATP-grasp superfamily ATP-dependent carboligase/protein-tyrosine-phosphatase